MDRRRGQRTDAGVDPATAAEAAGLQEVLAGYASDGFDATFLVTEPFGDLTCSVCGCTSAAERATLASLRRLEGASDPADMSAVAALTCPSCGARGTAVLRFGPEASEGEAMLLLAVTDERGTGVPGSHPTDEPDAPAASPGDAPSPPRRP